MPKLYPDRYYFHKKKKYIIRIGLLFRLIGMALKVEI